MAVARVVYLPMLWDGVRACSPSLQMLILFQTLILNNVSINSRKPLNVSSMSKTSLHSAIG